MARAPFVRHWGSYIEIGEDYLKVTKGNVCSAAVLNVLEYWTKLVWESSIKAEEFALPWVEGAIPKLYTTILGVYSQRSIQDSLKALEEQELISVDRPGTGQVNRYLINIALLNHLLFPNGKIAVGTDLGWNDILVYQIPNGKIAVGTASVAASVASVAYKETTSASEPVTETLPQNPFLEGPGRTPLDANSIRWISERFKSAGRKLNTADKRQFQEWLGECDFTEEQLEFALKVFFSQDYWRDKQFPPRAFQKKCQEYLDGTQSRPTPYPASSNSGVQPEFGDAVPSHAAASRESGGAGVDGAAPEDVRRHQGSTEASTGLETRDVLLENYLGMFLAAGASIGDYEREQAMPVWRTLTEEQKQRTCQDGLRHCNQTEAKYLSPAAHLRKKPWTRVTLERVLPSASPVLDKNKEALKILKRRHGVL